MPYVCPRWPSLCDVGNTASIRPCHPGRCWAGPLPPHGHIAIRATDTHTNTAINACKECKVVPMENRQGPPAYISRHPNYPRGTIAIADPHCPSPPKPSKGGGITGRGIQVLRSRCRHNLKARRGNLLTTWHRTQSGQQTRRLGRKSRRVRERPEASAESMVLQTRKREGTPQRVVPAGKRPRRNH